MFVKSWQRWQDSVCVADQFQITSTTVAIETDSIKPAVKAISAIVESNVLS